MHPTAGAAAGGEPAAPVVDSPAAARAALRWGFAQAVAADARTLTAVAPSFDDWPLDDPAVLTLLTGWLRRPQRRLVLLAGSFDGVPRALPRFVAWRRQWTHAVEPRQAAEDAAGSLPTWLFDDRRCVVEITDPLRGCGRAGDDPRWRQRCAERTVALLQRSSPAFAANTLGL